MPKMILTLVIFLVLIVSVPVALSDVFRTQKTINYDRLMRAIVEVEGWKGRDGKSGEKGKYQILPSTWYQYTTIPFTDRNVANHGDDIAQLHLSWIGIQIKKNNFPETSFNYALIWCAGWEAFRVSNYSPGKIDYALRIQNLYLDDSF